MGQDTVAEGSRHSVAVGSFIAVYAFADAWVLGVTITILAAFFNVLIVWIVAAVVLSSINIWACSWIDNQWDFWAAGSGRRLDRKLEKLRSGKKMKKPVEWVRRGSDLWFTLAAVVINAITVVALARVIGGKPIGHRRVLLAAIGYSIFFATVYSLIGLSIKDLV